MIVGMRKQYPLFQSHLDLAHGYWSQLIRPGDIAVDATCGNGHDTLVLMDLVGPQGSVFGIDIQKQALENTQRRVEEGIEESIRGKLVLIEGCHSSIPPSMSPRSISVVAYNLGYLPGGDKAFTTRVKSTIDSILNFRDYIRHGGAITITCYPGHPEGAREEQAIVELLGDFSPKEWNICHHRWINRRLPPSLLLIQHVIQES